jgi:glycosyltransferase involved in cell wall biosynthesis
LELNRTRKFEARLTNQLQRILVTSESDRIGLLSLAEKQNAGLKPDSEISIRPKITVVPNGVDLDHFLPSSEAREPQTLVITGKMSYHANVTAVVRFVKETMPKIWSDLPHTQLWIVGRDPAPEIRQLARLSFPAGKGDGNRKDRAGSRVHVTGTVEDIRPYLHKATLAVAPIRYGVGIQNKVLEAMACATPLVATRQAVGDIRAQSGRDLLAVDGDRELAPSIVSLMKDRDLQSSIGRAGRAFVEANHNWRTIALELTRIYRDADA